MNVLVYKVEMRQSGSRRIFKTKITLCTRQNCLAQNKEEKIKCVKMQHYDKYFIIFLLAIRSYEWPRSGVLVHGTILTKKR